MGTNILIQTSVGFLAAGLFISWVYFNIVTQAYQDILFRWRDLRDFKGLMKYYLFIEKKPPVHGKYNSGQRLIFTSWFIVFIFMLLTGLLLYSTSHGLVLPVPVIDQKVRFYHFLGALWFVGTVPLHIYLVLTEDPAKFQAMITGWIKK